MPDHSRLGLLGADAAQLPVRELLAQLDAGCVHISVDSDLAGARLTLRATITTLRRMPGRVHLDPRMLEPREVAALRLAATRIDPGRGLDVGESVPAGAIHVHIGVNPPSPTAIRAVPDGYGVHVARDADARITQARTPHPLGCIVTAGFAVAEAFKDLAPVVAARRVDHPHLTWCPVSLTQDVTAAPMIVDPLFVDLALAGCGAIGTAIAMILAELDASGAILILDRQEFGKENITTYSIGGEADARRNRRKVDMVAEVLAPRYTVTKRHGDLATLLDDITSGAIPWPRMVLAGLDSVAARHSVQQLWPDRIIDAATGGTAVGLHDVVADAGPCLMCFFPPGGHISSQERLAEISGLPLELLGRGDDVLLAEHLTDVGPDKRELLEQHVGKKICNLASALGLIEGGGDFQAAVTFVAVQAACLAVGRLLAIQLSLDPPNFVLYDSLLGPRDDAVERRKPNPACYCQQKAERISRVRRMRMA